MAFTELVVDHLELFARIEERLGPAVAGAGGVGDIVAVGVGSPPLAVLFLQIGADVEARLRVVRRVVVVGRQRVEQRLEDVDTDAEARRGVQRQARQPAQRCERRHDLDLVDVVEAAADMAQHAQHHDAAGDAVAHDGQPLAFPLARRDVLILENRCLDPAMVARHAGVEHVMRVEDCLVAVIAGDAVQRLGHLELGALAQHRQDYHFVLGTGGDGSPEGRRRHRVSDGRSHQIGSRRAQDDLTRQRQLRRRGRRHRQVQKFEQVRLHRHLVQIHESGRGGAVGEHQIQLLAALQR